MDWFTFGIQWLHVLFGIVWFGSALAANMILIPALGRLPLDRQREFAGVYGQAAERIMPIAAYGVIVLGILRGTVFGQIQSLSALTSTYGLTWLVGLIAASATLVWGKRALEPALHRMNAIPIGDALLADGKPAPVMLAALNAVKRVAVLELLGFFVVFTSMILMRFGL